MPYELISPLASSSKACCCRCFSLDSNATRESCLLFSSSSFNCRSSTSSSGVARIWEALVTLINCDNISESCKCFISMISVRSHHRLSSRSLSGVKELGRVGDRYVDIDFWDRPKNIVIVAGPSCTVVRLISIDTVGLWYLRRGRAYRQILRAPACPSLIFVAKFRLNFWTSLDSTAAPGPSLILRS